MKVRGWWVLKYDFSWKTSLLSFFFEITNLALTEKCDIFQILERLYFYKYNDLWDTSHG